MKADIKNIIKKMDDCSLCFEKMYETNVCILGCTHKFHYSCLQRWEENSRLCPLCRNRTIFSSFLTACVRGELNTVQKMFKNGSIMSYEYPPPLLLKFVISKNNKFLPKFTFKFCLLTDFYILKNLTSAFFTNRFQSWRPTFIILKFYIIRN